MRLQHLELLQNADNGFGLGYTESEVPEDPREVKFTSLKHYF